MRSLGPSWQMLFWVFLSFVPSGNYLKCLLRLTTLVLPFQKSLPIPLVVPESQPKNDCSAENQEVYYRIGRAGRYLHFSPRIQIPCHPPFNTLKQPKPSSPQRMSAVEITPTLKKNKNKKETPKYESQPYRLASLCTQMRGAAFQGEDSQGSPCPANFQYLPPSLKRNTKME